MVEQIKLDTGIVVVNTTMFSKTKNIKKIFVGDENNHKILTRLLEKAIKNWPVRIEYIGPKGDKGIKEYFCVNFVTFPGHKFTPEHTLNLRGDLSRKFSETYSENFIDDIRIKISSLKQAGIQKLVIICHMKDLSGISHNIVENIKGLEVEFAVAQ